MPARYVAPENLSHRWYLAEWAEYVGKTQADAQRDIGWPKSTASYLFNGRQRYTQNLIDEASRWLGIAPFELLLHPSEAVAIRNIRQSARVIAAEEEGRRFEHAPSAASDERSRTPRTGTGG